MLENALLVVNKGIKSIQRYAIKTVVLQEEGVYCT